MNGLKMKVLLCKNQRTQEYLHITRIYLSLFELKSGWIGKRIMDDQEMVRGLFNLLNSVYSINSVVSFTTPKTQHNKTKYMTQLLKILSICKRGFNNNRLRVLKHVHHIRS